MDSVNSDHKSSSESPQVSDERLIMPIPAGDVPPRDIVLCSGCGALTTTKYWDVHVGTHQDLNEIVEVLREVSRRMFDDPDMTVGAEIQRWLAKLNG